MARYKNREVSVISVKFEEPQVKIQHEDGSFEIVDQGGLVLTRDEMANSFKGLKEWGGSLEERNARRQDSFMEEFPDADEKTLTIEKPGEKDKNLVKNNNQRNQNMNTTTKSPNQPQRTNANVPNRNAPATQEGLAKRGNSTVTPVNSPKAPVR